MKRRVAAVLFAGAVGLSGLVACESQEEPAEPGRDESMLQPEPQVSGSSKQPSKAMNPYSPQDKGSIGIPPGGTH